MTRPRRRRLGWIRRPVRREDAERYLALTLVSFAATVIATRWFLQLTGFPKIGGGTCTSPTPCSAGCSYSWPPCCRS